MNGANKNQIVQFAMPEGRLLSGGVGMVEAVDEEGNMILYPVYLGSSTPWARVGMIEALLAKEKGQINRSWTDIE